VSLNPPTLFLALKGFFQYSRHRLFGRDAGRRLNCLGQRYQRQAR
jgi:hypothetical protein